MYLVGNTVTIRWTFAPTSVQLESTDFAVEIKSPAGVVFSGGGLTSFTPPTAITPGEATYDFLPTVEGNHILSLVSGSSQSSQVFDAVIVNASGYSVKPVNIILEDVFIPPTSTFFSLMTEPTCCSRDTETGEYIVAGGGATTQPKYQWTVTPSDDQSWSAEINIGTSNNRIPAQLARRAGTREWACLHRVPQNRDETTSQTVERSWLNADPGFGQPFAGTATGSAQGMNSYGYWFHYREDAIADILPAPGDGWTYGLSNRVVVVRANVSGGTEIAARDKSMNITNFQNQNFHCGATDGNLVIVVGIDTDGNGVDYPANTGIFRTMYNAAYPADYDMHANWGGNPPGTLNENDFSNRAGHHHNGIFMFGSTNGEAVIFTTSAGSVTGISYSTIEVGAIIRQLTYFVDQALWIAVTDTGNWYSSADNGSTWQTYALMNGQAYPYDVYSDADGTLLVLSDAQVVWLA